MYTDLKINFHVYEGTLGVVSPSIYAKRVGEAFRLQWPGCQLNIETSHDRNQANLSIEQNPAAAALSFAELEKIRSQALDLADEVLEYARGVMRMPANLPRPCLFAKQVNPR